MECTASNFATDFDFTGESPRVTFDTAAAREAGVFDVATATWGGNGVDADFMKMRLNDIDRAIMDRGGSRDKLHVNRPGRTVERKHFFRPSCLVTNVTPSTSQEPSREAYVDEDLNDARYVVGATGQRKF